MTDTITPPTRAAVKAHKWPDWMATMADMSTGHLTKEDSLLLDELRQGPQTPGDTTHGLIGGYMYGWVVETWPRSREHRKELKDAGFSKAYIDLIFRMHALGIWYIKFDCDAPHWEGFPTFNW